MIGITVLLLLAYFVGSFPIGLWIGQVMFHKNITASGSGNIGATNAYRVLGPLAGAIVFLGDFFKGAAPVIVMKSIKVSPELLPWLTVAAGMLAILGHTFSVFLRFKGGKAASTTVGVLAILAPKATLVIVILWIVTLGITRYVSVSSLTSAIALPALTLALYGKETPVVVFSFLVTSLIVFKHRSNISRLMQGVEPKVGVK